MVKKQPTTIAFDFDETLYNEMTNGWQPNWAVLKLLRDLHKAGHRVVIVTARYEPGTEPHNRFYQKVEQGALPSVDLFVDKYIRFDIPRYYTNQELKARTLVELGASILIDDREIERNAAQHEGIAVYDPQFISDI